MVVVKKKLPDGERFKAEMADDMRLVKGKFRCFEPIGGSATFSFRKWPGEKVQTYTMQDDLEYTIKKSVADHLNENCYWVQHKHTMDESGRPSKDVGKKFHRYAFIIKEYA